MASGAKRVWIYFNNDNDAYAIANAKTMRRLLSSSGRAKTARAKAVEHARGSA
jgi:uncharacterized protein YecE (DUF72 family)